MEIRKIYRYIFLYNPSKNIVSKLIVIHDQEEMDNAVSELYRVIDRTTETILGKSLGGDYYQLSATKYKNNIYYTKEDKASVRKFLNFGRIGVAVSKYITENKMWKEVDLGIKK